MEDAQMFHIILNENNHIRSQFPVILMWNSEIEVVINIKLFNRRVETEIKPDSVFEGLIDSLTNSLRYAAVDLPAHISALVAPLFQERVKTEQQVFQCLASAFRCPGRSRTGSTRNRISALQDFASSNWKGLITKKADTDQDLRDFFSSEKYTKCYALTGVPTLNAQEQYALSVDQIIGGSKNQDYVAYIVTAKPVSEDNVDAILRDCRDLQSQAESFKGLSISESLQKGETNSESHTVAKTITETVSGQVKDTNGNSTRNFIIAVTGLAVLATMVYPPALSVFTVGEHVATNFPHSGGFAGLETFGMFLQMFYRCFDMCIGDGL
jgi:hypothetical protein